MPNLLEETLRRVPFLREVPLVTLVAVQEGGIVRRFEEGVVLFAEGDPAPGLFVVTAGRVRLYKIDRRGREMVLGVAERGGVVGAPATFDGGNCPYHASATGTAGAALFHVPAARWQALIDAHPTLAVGAVRFLSVQNRRLIELLKAQALHTVRARFAAYLLHAAGDRDTFTLPESNIGIAGQLGTVREVISRTLHQLADLGYITVAGRTVTVQDRTGLETFAVEKSA